MKINFYNQTEYQTKEYEDLIKHVFKNESKRKIFNIIFVSKEEIQRINREYRKIDKVTDVISFALQDSDNSSFGPLAKLELGDIFICLDRAFEQAHDYGHSVNREVAFLSVHGYLHLNGYDHMNKEDEEIMFNKQEEILNKAGIERK